MSAESLGVRGTKGPSQGVPQPHQLIHPLKEHCYPVSETIETPEQKQNIGDPGGSEKAITCAHFGGAAWFLHGYPFFYSLHL